MAMAMATVKERAMAMASTLLPNGCALQFVGCLGLGTGPVGGQTRNLGRLTMTMRLAAATPELLRTM